MAKKINKSQLAKIDGMKSLLKILGEDNFIKAVIENTYFFSPTLVHSRFEELSKLIFDGNDIPARKSTQDDLYRIEGERRFFVDKGYESALPGGAKFYISNQWGTQTDAFMEYVNNSVDGITVTKL